MVKFKNIGNKNLPKEKYLIQIGIELGQNITSVVDRALLCLESNKLLSEQDIRKMETLSSISHGDHYTVAIT